VSTASAWLWSWRPQDTYLLPLLNFGEHNDGVALPLPHHPPEILHRVRERSLRGNEVILLAIALRRDSRTRSRRERGGTGRVVVVREEMAPSSGASRGRSTARWFLPTWRHPARPILAPCQKRRKKSPIFTIPSSILWLFTVTAEGMRFCSHRYLKGLLNEISITTAAISFTTELTINSIFELWLYLHADVISTAVVSTLLNR